jgi:hypothetical protein
LQFERRGPVVISLQYSNIFSSAFSESANEISDHPEILVTEKKPHFVGVILLILNNYTARPVGRTVFTYYNFVLKIRILPKGALKSLLDEAFMIV